MIFVMLLELAIIVVRAFVFLFPGGTPIQAFEGMQTLLAGAQALNAVLPVAEMFTALGVLLTAVGALVIWRAALFIYHEIPFNH